MDSMNTDKIIYGELIDSQPLGPDTQVYNHETAF
jgi:hypothetical protein